ncbi:hypothetical protein IT407_03310 [Candidatus Uhrbacteria bacterium]|nr:hypothetical protein [Candidatus Uhrbacteria bacterium]
METRTIENKDGYLELAGLKAGVLYGASLDEPRRIKADLSSLPAEYFGANEQFIDGFLGSPFTGPTTPDRVGPYVRGEYARLKANSLI